MNNKYQIMICALFYFIQIIKCELRFAWTMFRHGARAPERGLDANHNDLLGEHWTSPGELTPVGMRMHYLLGTRNRVRYQNFLSTSWNPIEMFVRSSDYNRTMMSAQSQLNGLFPAPTGPTLTAFQQGVAYPPINKNFGNWTQDSAGANALPNQMQVFPVHLWSKLDKRQFFFYDSSVFCPKIIDLIVQNQKKKLFSDWLAKFNQDWGTKLSQVIKTTDPNYFLTYGNVFLIMDTFVSAYTEGKELKKMTDAGIDLAKFNETAYDFHMNDIYESTNGDPDNILPIITMSGFTSEILTWMDNRISDDIKGVSYRSYFAPKFVMFSAHDVTLGSALLYLKAAFGTQIYYTPFASSLFFELSRPDGKAYNTLTANDYTVQIIYNDHSLKTMDYPAFKSGMTKNQWTEDQVATYCGYAETIFNSYYYATVVLACLGFVFLILIVILLVKCCGQKGDSRIVHDKPMTTV